MATKKGVWNLQQVRDKQLQDLWTSRNGTNWFVGRAEKGIGSTSVPDVSRQYSSPTQLTGDWTKIYHGGNHNESNTIAGVKATGTLYVWGMNQFGQVGNNSQGPGNTGLSSPVQVPGTTWSNLCNGAKFKVATKTDGTLWTWGENNDGELGVNSRIAYSSPVQVPGTTWSKMSGSHDNAYGIKTDGTLWVWGYNVGGALGLNQPDNTRYSSPVQVPGTTWSDITGGYRSAVAVKTDGTLWSWGYNSMGGLGQNSRTEVSSPIQIGTATDWTSTNLDGEKYGKQSFVISKKV